MEIDVAVIWNKGPASYTVNDPQNRQNITDPSREEHRAAIFRIVKR